MAGRSRAAGFSKKEKLVSVMEAKEQMENDRRRVYDPMRSLLYDYQNLKDVSLTEIAIQNKRNLYEGISHPAGPKGALSPERIDTINRLADIKLQSILDSGLTREELIGIKRKVGGPKPRKLSQDPFFMLILNNHKARLNLIKDSEEFSVDKIVGLALRQDVGPDRSMVSLGHRLIQEKTPHNAEKRNLPAHYSKDEEVDDYYRTTKLPTTVEYDTSDKLDMWKPIVKKPEKIPKKQKLDKRLLHWRNTEYLVNFMSNFAKIRHAKLNNLSNKDQRTVKIHIQRARNMGILPQTSHVRPYHKVPLRTLDEDIANDIRYAFDYENGTITREEDDEVFNFRTQHFSLSHGFLQKVDLTTPDPEVTQIKRATDYLLHEKATVMKELGVDPDKGLEESALYGLKVQSFEGKNLSEEDVEEGEKALGALRAKYKELATEDLLGCLIAEKSGDPNNLAALLENKMPPLDPAEVPTESYEELLDKIQIIKLSIKKSKVNLGPSTLYNKSVEKIVQQVQEAVPTD